MTSEMSRDDKRELFAELYHHCKDPKEYSARTVMQKMGYTYEQFEALAVNDEVLQNALEICLGVCASHAEKDGLNKKLPAAEAMKYMLEGDSEFRELYPTKEAQDELIRSCQK